MCVMCAVGMAPANETGPAPARRTSPTLTQAQHIPSHPKTHPPPAPRPRPRQANFGKPRGEFDFAAVEPAKAYAEYEETGKRLEALKERGIEKQVGGGGACGRRRGMGCVGGHGRAAERDGSTGSDGCRRAAPRWAGGDPASPRPSPHTQRHTQAGAPSLHPSPLAPPPQADTMYRRNKEEVEALQAKRSQVRQPGASAAAGRGAGRP